MGRGSLPALGKGQQGKQSGMESPRMFDEVELTEEELLVSGPQLWSRVRLLLSLYVTCSFAFVAMDMQLLNASGHHPAGP